MTHTLRGLALVLSLALVSTLALAPQAKAQSTSSTPIAYVYILPNNNATPAEGASVTLYDTASNGSLTQVGNYPLESSINSLIGGNGSYLFAAAEDSPNVAGETNIDSYPVASNGALGARAESIDTDAYAGSGPGCSNDSIVSATLDHTGHYMFVRVINQDAQTQTDICDQWQTYTIASNGLLTYIGREASPLIGYLETISSSNEFSYGTSEGSACSAEVGEGNPGPEFYPYSRTSDLVLSYDHNFTHTDPAGTPSSAYTLWASADPTDHLAVLMDNCTNSYGLPASIASYTINSQTGSITSTNSWSSLPTSTVNSDLPTNAQTPMFTSMSPSGQLLAVAGGGFQIFHFNGASPLTPYTSLQIGTAEIRQAAWDNDNHFYTLDWFTGQLQVYTVTPTSFSQAPGSPLSANAGAMVVVSIAPTTGACSAPSTNGVNVCSPAEGATLTSPVSINAAATVSGGVYRFSLWNGDTKLLNEDNGVMAGSVSLAPGTYKLIFDAVNSSGVHADATRDITVR
jgi:hypothetical protein